jgi:ABC-2 type transport system permease protein
VCSSDLPQLVREGTFDLLLVRPLGTLFQVVTSDFALRRIAKALQGSIVLVYAVSVLDVDWSLARVGMVFLMVVCGVAIFASIWITGAATVIWTVEGSEWLNAFTYGGNFLTQYPVNLFGRWFRRLFVYLLPLGFVAYFPALYVLDKPDPLGLPRALQFASPIVAVVAVAVTAVVWRAAVRHYRSAGG